MGRDFKLVNTKVNTEQAMENNMTTDGKGWFGSIRRKLNRNRLGELLLEDGRISATDLADALRIQRESHRPLGKILLETGMISKTGLWASLAEQTSVRALAAMFTLFLSFGAVTGGASQARAGTIRDIPEIMQVENMEIQARYFAPMNEYPRLFGSEERRSSNLKPFTKWSGMFDRFEKAMQNDSDIRDIQALRSELIRFQGLELEDMADRVNALINKKPYILDSKNWGKSDYWATPVEFMARGGDCEDFAIAKYVALRALGVPEERLRLAVVHDKEKNIPHAVLVVYADSDAYILDNQESRALLQKRVNRYRPIFSINRQAWWLHTSPNATLVASAR